MLVIVENYNQIRSDLHEKIKMCILLLPNYVVLCLVSPTSQHWLESIYVFIKYYYVILYSGYMVHSFEYAISAY